MKVLEDTPASSFIARKALRMNTDYSYEVDQRSKNPHLIKTVFRSWFLVCQPVIPPVFPSSTPMTSSRQEIDHPTSSSSSSTSPTTTVSSDNETRAREDLCGINSYPVSVSSEHVGKDKNGETPLTKPTKNPKPNKNEDHEFERGDPLYFRNSGMAARIQRKSRG